jgi:hypothetical protein
LITKDAILKNILLTLLLSDVTSYRFLRYMTCTTTIVATCPEARELFPVLVIQILQPRKMTTKLFTGFSFQLMDYVAWSVRGLRTNKTMNMVRHNLQRKKFQTHVLTLASKDVPQSHGNDPLKHRSPELWYPYQMIVDVMLAMKTCPDDSNLNIEFLLLWIEVRISV